MLEQQINTPCGKYQIDGNLELQDLLNKVQREGAEGGKPVAPQSWRQRQIDKLYEHYVNGLLSGTYTQLKNIAGNTVPLAARIIETSAAVPISRLQQALGQEVDRVTYNELVAEMGGLGQGFLDALTFGRKRMKSMLDQDVSNEDILKQMNMPEKLAMQAKIERKQRAIHGDNIDNWLLSKIGNWYGNAVNFPGAMLSSMDVFFKVINYRADISKTSMRFAANSGTTDAKAIKDLYEETLGQVMSGKRQDLIDAGVANADRQTFTNAPEGKWNQIMANKGHDAPGMRWIVPFRRTMVNLINYGVERTPIAPAFSSRTRQQLQKGGAAQAEALSRMAVGTAVLGAIGATATDVFTGEAPRDDQAKDLWLKNGNKPYSLKIGGQNIDMDLFGPLTPFLKAWGQYQTMASNVAYEDEGEYSAMTEAAGTLLFAMADSLYEEHWLSSISGFAATLDRSRRDNDPAPLLALGVNLMKGFVPRIVQEVNQGMLDPGVKYTKGSPMDKFLAVMPGLSSRVTDKIDLWGDVQTHEHFIDPTLASTITGKDMVAEELFRLGMHIPVSGRTHAGVTMTSKEYQQYMVLSGKGTFGLPPLRTALISAMKDPIYKRFTTDIGRSNYVTSIINSYRKAARAKMEMTTDWGRRVNIQREQTAINTGVNQ